MSLVGTRPPTVDEWEQYEPHHRGRMAMKPGLTGMWQVSGRSDITDFEEVVKLDMDYIQKWNILPVYRICPVVFPAGNVSDIGFGLQHPGRSHWRYSLFCRV